MSVPTAIIYAIQAYGDARADGETERGAMHLASAIDMMSGELDSLTAENAALKKQNEEFRALLAKSADQLVVWSKLAGALEGEPR